MKPCRYVIFLSLFLLVACRGDDIVLLPEEVPVSNPVLSDLKGFYLLNEGNMGSNKCTLDFYSYSTGVYIRNIYGNANPGVPMELGDVGNDLAIYGSRLYAVINCSNKIEVLDAVTARRIGYVDLPNCRSIKFRDGYAYVTSYAGPVEISPDYRQLGYVAKIDTVTLQIVDRCIVGYQPDGIEIVGSNIYVANSGGYMVPNYENTVSVIDISTFREIERIPIAINLHKIRADRQGKLWISSRGDYYTEESALYCYDTRKHRLEKKFDIPVSNMWIDDEKLYVVSTSWNYESMSDEVIFAIIDTSAVQCISKCFITDGTEKEIQKPYALAVNPLSKEIYVSDARNYVNPGWLYCYSPDGCRQWAVRTGDIPSRVAFFGKDSRND